MLNTVSTAVQTNTPTPSSPPTAPTIAQSPDPTIARRVIALLDAYPTLSLPIATAMVERALLEPTGKILAQLEGALDQFDSLPDVTQLTGSQIRVLDVALQQVNARISQLQTQLQLAWGDE